MHSSATTRFGKVWVQTCQFDALFARMLLPWTGLNFINLTFRLQLDWTGSLCAMPVTATGRPLANRNHGNHELCLCTLQALANSEAPRQTPNDPTESFPKMCLLNGGLCASYTTLYCKTCICRVHAALSISKRWQKCSSKYAHNQYTQIALTGSTSFSQAIEKFSPVKWT